MALEILCAKGPTAKGGEGELLARQDTCAMDADLKRRKSLFGRRAISQAEYDTAAAGADEARAGVVAAKARIEAARATVSAAEARREQVRLNREKLFLYAPIDGVVASINISEGQYWSPNFLNTSSEDGALRTIPILLVDPHNFEVTLDLPSLDGRRVSVGQQAFLLTAQDGSIEQGSECDNCDIESRSVPAVVYAVSPTINPGGRSIQIKLRTTGPDKRLSDGLHLSAWIVVAERPDALVVPRNALIFRGGKRHVFVVGADNTVTQRTVKV
jgi:multidrug efflux pump subunit AcrA (membrane-fusion protein)